MQDGIARYGAIIKATGIKAEQILGHAGAQIWLVPGGL